MNALRIEKIIGLAFCLGCILLIKGIAFGQVLEVRKYPAPGIEYNLFQVDSDREGEGIQKIHILRIDPLRAKLRLLTASGGDRKLRTSTEWCRDFNLVAAINAGMFLKDYSTNVGYLRAGSHVQNGRWNKKYKSVLALEPTKNGIPPAVLIDLDDPDAKKSLGDYAAVVQNLRLLKEGGVNVWGESERRWSEAALAIDREGRILFIFCQSPLAMWQFNQMLLSLGLGVLRGMHLEGGPLASFSVKSRDLSLELAGVYETGFNLGNGSGQQVPIPNVIGVEAVK